MGMHDAELGDVYVDDQGKLWRVFMKCGEPTVHVQEIERLGDYPEAVHMSGGVSGQMWQGFKRIYRPQKGTE